MAGTHTSKPIVSSDIEPIASTISLSFLDLQEVLFVDAFLDAGVTWKTMRAAHRAAEQLLGHHPFATGRFATNGRQILLDLTEDVAEGDSAFQELISNQLAFRRVVLPYLVKVDFEKQGRAIRWWPIGKRRRIVVDPERSFGQPIVSREGVPTLVLARAFRAEQSIPMVARWYAVSRQSVADAVKFEAGLKAA